MDGSRSTAFEQAEALGLRFFWARLYTGEAVKFLGRAWQDGGFAPDPEDADRPLTDAEGNTVRQYTVETLNPDDPLHVAQAEQWWEQGG